MCLAARTGSMGDRRETHMSAQPHKEKGVEGDGGQGRCDGKEQVPLSRSGQTAPGRTSVPGGTAAPWTPRWAGSHPGGRHKESMRKESQAPGKERSCKAPILTHLTWQMVGRTSAGLTRGKKEEHTRESQAPFSGNDLGGLYFC